MKKHSDSLLFRFAIIFLLFTLITLIMCGIATYSAQNKAYKQEREMSAHQVGSYLEEILAVDGNDFVYWQEYFCSHSQELLVPYDFKTEDIQTARQKYEELFAKNYPGKVLGKDISFEELSDEVKNAYTVYKHEYYLDQFEQARDRFNLAYAYYIIPNEETLEINYALDALRDERIVDGKKYIELGITVTHEPETGHQIEWDSWINEVPSKGFDVFDNELGNTYACYTPVFINGKKLGLIGVELDVININTSILHDSFRHIFYIGIILIITVAALLHFIYMQYIIKLSKLKDNVKLYSQKKDVAIATEIEKHATGKDEISVLALQVSSMIRELENYMKNLLKTTTELENTRGKVKVMNELATKDSLTGIRNKTAYDIEVQSLERTMKSEKTKFAIAMIDLNFLKQINDTYGHERGNCALKKLCYTVCHTFVHSPVFRVGGDEFVVILKNGDYEKRDILINEFHQNIEKIQADDTLEKWERISAAIGVAVYDFQTDSSVASVFARADQAMYQNKKAMKAVRKD